MSAAKERHLLFSKVAEKITSNGGVVFGGYARSLLLHHEGANQYYRFFNTDLYYEDETIHEESYINRTTYPNDIDTFASSISEWNRISDIVISSFKTPLKKISCKRTGEYNQHPNFCLFFSAHRYIYEYNYDVSLQSKGSVIYMSIDVIIPNSNSTFQDFMLKCMYDCSCNLFYINKYGLQHVLANGDAISRALKLSKLCEMTVNKVCFITQPCDTFLTPTEETEIRAVCLRMQGYSYEEVKEIFKLDENNIKYKYKIKFIKRIIKMHEAGWNVLNSPFVTHIYKSDDSTKEICNNEFECFISKEQFVENEYIYKFVDSSKSFFSRSSMMKYFNSPTPSMVKNLAEKWFLTCPMTRKEIAVFDSNRSVSI